MKPSVRFRQAVLFRAREAFMRSFGRSTIAAALLVLQELICSFFASGIAERFSAYKLNIAGYPFDWVFYAVLFLISILLGPTMLGVTEFFLTQLRTRNGRIGNIFSWFGDFDRMTQGLKLGLARAGLTVLLQLLGELPAFIMFKSGIPLDKLIFNPPPTADPAALYASVYSPEFVAVSAITYAILLLAQIPLLYTLATEYILVASGSPKKRIGEAFRESFSLMRGHVFQFVGMLLYMLPILILMSACGIFVFCAFGLFSCMQASFVDTLLFRRDLRERGIIPSDDFLPPPPPEIKPEA